MITTVINKNFVFVQYKGNLDYDYLEAFVENYLDEPEYIRSLGVFKKKQVQSIKFDINDLSSFILRSSVCLVLRFYKRDILIAEESTLFELPTPINFRIKQDRYLCCSPDEKLFVWEHTGKGEIPYQVVLRWKRENDVASSFRIITTNRIPISYIPKEKNLEVWIEYKFTNLLSINSNKILV